MLVMLLWVYIHTWASLKNMPGHGGNRTYDLWNTSPTLCQLSYAVRSVRVCDLSELSLVSSIFPPWPCIFFKLARCRYTLRVTSQTSERYGHYVLRGFFQEFPCVGCFLILCVLALTRLISRHRNCHWLGLRKSWNRTKKSRYSFPFQWIWIFHALTQWTNPQLTKILISTSINKIPS